jgi:hypothetical protein
MYLIHETTPEAAVSIINSGYIKASKMVNATNKSIYGELDYVFFNTIPEDRIPTLPGNVYFIFETTALLDRKFGISESNTAGGEKNRKYLYTRKNKLDEQLFKLYTNSVQRTTGRNMKKYRNVLYL